MLGNYGSLFLDQLFSTMVKVTEIRMKFSVQCICFKCFSFYSFNSSAEMSDTHLIHFIQPSLESKVQKID